MARPTGVGKSRENKSLDRPTPENGAFENKGVSGETSNPSDEPIGIAGILMALDEMRHLNMLINMAACDLGEAYQRYAIHAGTDRVNDLIETAMREVGRLEK